MKLVRWRRFTWDLSKLPQLETPLLGCYNIRPAERAEEKTVAHVIFSAFSLDSAWSDALKDFRVPLQTQIEASFLREEVAALVICHGQRIIAASALNPAPDSDNHLLSGPCVLMEYRNRGLGTALLHHSLRQLQSAGLPRAHGITKENVAASKFIYPKFNSTSTECSIEPALTAGA